MTPKEKAKELVHKYDLYTEKYTDGWIQSDLHSDKFLASISVDEILKALYEYDKNTEEYLKEDFGDKFMLCELQNMEWDFRYWQLVKQEIEKL